MRAASERPPTTMRTPSTSMRFMGVSCVCNCRLLGDCNCRLLGDCNCRLCECGGGIIIRAMTRTSFSFAALLLMCGAAALVAQQQAAEGPATDRRASTRPAVAGLHGLVTTGHPIASSAGLQMLLRGGNAFDAAVAVGAMAPLGEPQMNGIGGNGFMTVYDKKTGKVWSVSMAGAAPKALKPAE